MPNTPRFLIAFEFTPRLHRCDQSGLRDCPAEETRDAKKEIKLARRTPAEVGPLSFLKTALLTACSINLACLSYLRLLLQLSAAAI